jgi:anaerobic selenocysteine-containing dehydrogenase
MEEFITACPRNCYSTCTFLVQVENNRIKRILPFAENLATPEGPCIKGLSYMERAHSEKRLIHPLRKNSKGKFEKISVNEAFEHISDRLAEIKSKYGSHSLLWYKGSGNSGLLNETSYEFWKAFGGVTTTYGNLCWPAGLEAVRLTLGSVKHNLPWDIENASLIVIWGKNPAETNIQEMAFIARAAEKGCRIIVIDSRRTPTADKADMLLCPKPGTDGALALAIARVLIEKNLVDHNFIRENVYGFDEFAENLTLSVRDAGVITGIPPGKITEVAEIIGTSVPVTFIPGYGLQRHQNGGATIRAILSLAVITGNIGKKGAGFNYANLQGYIYDTIKEPLSYYPDPEKDKPFRRTVSMTRTGLDMMKLNDPELKAVWVERGNPLLQLPDTATVREAFSKLEFKVVIDQFITDTALEADIILPAKDIFEQSDIVSSYWSPYVQYKPKMLEPEGDILPESEIYYHLARRMNLNIPEDSIPSPGNTNAEKWLAKRIAGISSLNIDALKKGPVLAPGLQHIAFEDMKFETSSGKIELLSFETVEKWNSSSLPHYLPVELSESDLKYPLAFLTPNMAGRIHSQFGNLDIIREVAGTPGLEISPADAAERSIEQGMKVKVFNDRGEIFTNAIVSNRVPTGVVSLPNGIWMNEGGGGNFLIAPIETDIGFGAAFHDTRVQVERHNEYA